MIEYELIPFEKIMEAVPPSFEKMHHYLYNVGHNNKNGEIGTIELTYNLPYRSELGIKGFAADFDEMKTFFSNVTIENHWIPDMENPLYWEYEQKFTIFANPYKRIESQTITVTLKNKIDFNE